MARGGARPGAGRPQGARDKLDRKAAEVAALDGVMPKDFLLGIVRDKDQPLDIRMEAAKAAAPYYHPKLASTELTGTLGLSHEDRLDALR